METVLQGPDGQPAIDEQSGKPLTMEEMLRRRGIVRMGNTTSMIGPDSAAQGTPSNVAASSAASNALKSRAGTSDPAAASALAKTLPPDIKNATPEQAAQTIAATGADPSLVQTLEGLGVVAAGTAAAYAIYKMRGARPTSEMPVREGMPAGVPEDAHFYDAPTNRLPGPSGNAQVNGPSAVQQVRGQQQKKLPAPAQALPKPDTSRKAAAEALQARAARGQPNDMAPIAGHAPISTVAEPLDAGVARTVGVSSELAKMLKANPGLLKTLSRIP